MGILDIFKQNSTKKETGPLNLEKPLIINLTKGFKKLDLDKPDILVNSLFVLDVSGSMDEKLHDGIRKIDSLRAVMEKIPTAKLICFSHNIYTNQNIPEPNGSTRLDMAFRYIDNKPSFEKPKKVILVSDGMPDDKTLSLNTAKKLMLPVDVIYIGKEGTEGEEFMVTLAEATGGKQLTV